MKPFRWDIRRREQLGRLLEGEEPRPFEGFAGEVRQAAARIVSTAGDARLVFLGRSPETFFDYLSGVTLSTPWADRLDLVNLSLRHQELSVATETRLAFRDHLESLGMGPRAIAEGRWPVAIVDLVHSGGTIRDFVDLLLRWADDLRLDRAAVRRRLRIVGVTYRTKSSPNTRRWQQGSHTAWLGEYPRIAVKNVSISGPLWAYLGNDQPKVTPSHPPWRWADPTAAEPDRHPWHLLALRHAARVFDRGTDPAERERFALELGQTPALRTRWGRELVLQLRNRAG
jgi:hypothetical protein